MQTSIKRDWLRALRLLALIAFSGLGSLRSHPALALQSLDASDGATVQAWVAIKEPTRVRVEGASITDVVGNLYSSHNCDGAAAGGVLAGAAAVPGAGSVTGAQPAVIINPQGELILECNRDKGEIYLKPVAAGSSTKPINLFVSTAQATYTLLLQRMDRPADTIVLRDAYVDGHAGAHGDVRAASLAARTRSDPAAQQRSQERSLLSAAQGPAPSHIRSLKAMLVLMATDYVPSDTRVEEVNRPVRLWQQARFSLLRVYQRRGYVGERYQLTNVGSEPMVLEDQEFDRESGNVVGVSIENHTLLPQASTAVYVIRVSDGTDAVGAAKGLGGGRP